jgi:anti-sigma regulatory factor (Ser/Thr protein kinase)
LPSIQKNFTRHLESLAPVFDLLDQFTRGEGVDDESKHAVSLAVDELFTNMVKYQPDNANAITLELRVVDDTMIVHLIDRDVDKFDLTKKREPNLLASLDERTPGGLGIFLTKKLMDDVQYRYGDRTSIIILKKKFRRKHV